MGRYIYVCRFMFASVSWLSNVSGATGAGRIRDVTGVSYYIQVLMFSKNVYDGLRKMSKKMCLDDFKKNAAENGLPTGKTPLIPYTLPRLHRGKVWFVDFYCFDPVTGRMRRKKYHLNRIKPVKERYDRAAELIAAVTMRLRSGWNVWVQTESTREQTPWTECVGYYRAYCERAAKKGVMKDKTAYGYLNYLDSFLKWMQQNVRPVLYCYQVDVFLLQDFLDYVLIDRERSARTRNNYLTWLSTLCTWMVQKGYLRDNPTAKIAKLREEPKQRTALSAAELERLNGYLAARNKFYLLACLMEYYTFIRPVELVQIKIENISIREQKVFVPGAVSKNRRDGMVGLNETVLRLMVELRTFDSPGGYYLFGRDFKPSGKRADGRIFREYFVKVREALKWDESKMFYSLKDSGIRDLANAEGIVVARDQARHTDISTTNKYLVRDGLTVHEETKHFKGAMNGDDEE